MGRKDLDSKEINVAMINIVLPETKANLVHTERNNPSPVRGR
jgi:hypothetical protein